DPSPANDLPADEETDGFDNNAGVLTVSSLHAEKYVLVSEALAKAAVANVASLTGCDTASKGEDACAADFAKRFGRRAFRRPTTSADEQMLMAAYASGKDGGSYAEGIEVMIRAALQSPHFLYRLELTTPADPNAQLVPLSPYELATRLSFLIWGAGPDDALLDAAGRGDLSSKAGAAAQARAMLADPRARVAITNFFNEWIGTSRLDITSKSSAQFPLFSEAVRDGMKQETSALVQYVLWTGDHRLATLLTTPLAFVTPALAAVYGVSAPKATATAPQMVTLPDSQQRAGILTQASFLAVQAHPDQTSPVLRGKFVRGKLLCQPPPPPPADVNISVPDVSSAKTARDRFSAHLTAGASCNGCHQLMDPIGLAFEKFDSIGSYRDTENGAAIDVSGQVIAPTDPGLAGSFTGVRELATKLAASDEVSDCMSTQWFRYASGRTEEVPDGCSLTTMQDAFAASGGDLVELFVAMTQTDAFWYRAPITP
ncbi:MAG TPA: DUF1592 domain-containing protein, partial [Polyangia bacterium]|nr:DUF1592 domain-containing protein [Polyangia bacterium]